MSKRESGRLAMAGRKELGKDARGLIIQILGAHPAWKGSRYPKGNQTKACGKY